MSQIADWSLIETANAIAKRTVSAVEVTEAVLGRIDARQPVLNAFIRVDKDGARAAAKAADARQAAGGKLGPLHGVPLAHKDMFYRPTGHYVHYGPTRNPWHPEHITGGSSSGSETAVASGFSKTGAPVGIRCVDRPFAEAVLFRMAAASERETGWPDAKPPMAGM
ncbi:MAG: amidase family protein [Hyphomicrobiaceae bacterium]